MSKLIVDWIDASISINRDQIEITSKDSLEFNKGKREYIDGIKSMEVDVTIHFVSSSEIIVYSKPLSTAERQAIENYLNIKYDR